MRFLCASLVVVSVIGSVCLADWPQFQGPARNGVSPEKGLANSWPATGPKDLWKFDLSSGFGGPAIQGGKVYLMDRTGDVGQEKDVIRCIDLATGKEDWNKSYDAPGKIDRPGSRATPIVDGKYVYTAGPMGHLFCRDKKNGEVVWSKNIVKDYGAFVPGWKISQSPYIYKNLLIVAPQGAQVGVVALDKVNSTEVWKSAPVGHMAYASPYVTAIDGVEQVITLGAKGDKAETVIVSGIDVKNGKVLWSYDGWSCSTAVIPTPTDCGKGRFFVTGGYQDAGCAMFQVKHEGENWTVSEVFHYKQEDPDSVMSKIQNPILYDGFLYANSSVGNRKNLVCLGLDGKIKWSTAKQQSFDDGNLVIADGKIYIMEGDKGILHMVKATPDGYQPLAKAQVLAGAMVWAPMAISDGKLICRDQKRVKCFDLKSK